MPKKNRKIIIHKSDKVKTKNIKRSWMTWIYKGLVQNATLIGHIFINFDCIQKDHQKNNSQIDFPEKKTY